jgi:heme exporter protein B
LIKKEFKLELRRKSVISGILLYLTSLIFIIYLTFNLKQNAISEATWSALFWIVILFCVMNSVAKSFIGEKQGVFIYYYTIASPQAIILSKIIYNSLLCMVLTFTGYSLFVMFVGNPVQDQPLFIATLIVTSIGFSSTLSFISGIASKASNNNVLMAVLSFPVLIAIMMLTIKITKNALDGLDTTVSYDELINLLAINSISTVLAYLLFPYIWRS